MKFPLLVLTTVMLLQAGTFTPAALLKLERPLTAAETEAVVSGIRQALAGKTLRLVDKFQGDPEILMGRDGMPLLVRFKGHGDSVAGSTARALVSRMSIPDNVMLTGDPAPNPAEFVPIQSLWIDTGSLLPLRWEVFQRQAQLDAIDFVYEQIDLRRPAGVKPPTCIP